MHTKILKPSILITNSLVLVLLGASVQGAFIVKPTGASASTAPNSHRLPGKTIDGSGLSSALSTDDPLPETWPNHDTGNSNGWFSDDTVTISNHHITFDLGDEYSLTGLHIWNWNFNGGGTQTNDGINDVILEFSTDGVDFSTISSQSLTFGQGQNSSYPGDGYSLDSVSASHVRFNIQTTFEHGADEVGKAAFAEVRFTAIPEPASVALLGLGTVALFSRRRRWSA